MVLTRGDRKRTRLTGKVDDNNFGHHKDGIKRSRSSVRGAFDDLRDRGGNL